jgi:hypothetical protein
VPTYNLEEGSVQEAFQNSRAKIEIFGGSYGNGKSTGMIIKALKMAKLYPGSLGLMARATYPKLNDTLRRDFFKWCPRRWIKRRPTKDDNSCYMHDGTTIHFRYVSQKGKNTEDGSTTSNVLSATYDWIVVDQIEDPEISYKDFLDLLGRLRGATPFRETKDMSEAEIMTWPETGPRLMLLGCNPTRNWVYRELIAPYHMWKNRGIYTDKLLVDKITKQPIMELFESDVYANRKNLPEDYIPTLEATYKGQMHDRYVLGKWSAYEGLIHAEYDAQRHCLSHKDIMEYLTELRQGHVIVKALEGYDFGLSNASCYILGFVDDIGRVILVDGYYEPGLSYDKQPDRINEIRQRYFGLIEFSEEPIIADPDIFRKKVVAKRETGVSVAKLFNDLGLRMRPGHNDITAGIAKVNGYLSDKLGARHLLTEEPAGPMLYVCEDLTWFDNEITNYYWKKNPLGQQIDEPQEHNDHAMNTIKYMLSFLPEPSEIIVPADKLPPDWMFWHEMDPQDYAAAINNRYGNY